MKNKVVYIFGCLCALFLACTPEAKPGVQGQAPTQDLPITIRGTIYDDGGNRLAGVVVSDGAQCVKTDAQGLFELASDLEVAKFVFVSIPSGYSVPVKNGLPIFFKRLSEEKQADGKYILEFILNKMSKNPDRYSMLFVADPQPRTRNKAHDRVAYHSLDCCNDLYRDMRETGAGIMSDRPCYAMMLGDIVHDDMSLFDKYIEDGTSKMGFPTFNVIGNHDNKPKAADDVDAASVFEEKFGPSNYSFNLGKIHYIVVDNMITGGGMGLRDDLIQWMKSDLSYVDKSTTVMICSHAPMFMCDGVENYSSARNGSAYAALLAGYKKVYAWAGHTHAMSHHVYDDKSQLKNIEAHTIVRATGELWTNEYQSSGTPRGYVLVDVDGDDVTWKFKPTIYQTANPFSTTPAYNYRRWNYNIDGVAQMKEGGNILDSSYQMNVYPKGTHGDNYIYVNVFMWDQLWGTPVFVSDSNPQCEYKFTKVTSRGKLDMAQQEIYKFYSAESQTFKEYGTYSWSDASWQRTFVYYTNKASDSGTIKVTDRFGNVFTQRIAW